MEKHFCDNAKCGREIKFGGAEPESKLLIVVEFVKITKDEKPFGMGYGIRTLPYSLGKLVFCGKGCAVEYLNEKLKEVNNSVICKTCIPGSTGLIATMEPSKVFYFIN